MDAAAHAAVVKYQKKFGADGQLDAGTLAGPLAKGMVQYTKGGYFIVAAPLGKEAQDPAHVN
ncbi:MAG: hypothetical protein P4L36_19440 [Holophaga sp.]|nr:hypothetical protein [Holophaga sp.]